MSASPSPTLTQPVASHPVEAPLVAPASLAELDASCRVPVMLMLVSAAIWLVIGGLLGTLASLQLVVPDLLAHCPSMSYGRVYPAHWNAFAYGFGVQAGLGVALWLLARLGKEPLGNPWLVAFAVKLWNLGVTVGILGILFGDTTGFEWLEMPRYASGVLFCAYGLIGGSALFNLHFRRERSLYPSQWFLLAALIWFPWIYSVANLLLVVSPVTGVMQSLVGWWYANNLLTLFFGSVGLAALFYFIPKQTGRPLHSQQLALFAFWTFALFGGWGGVPVNAPVPGWICALSSSAAVAMLVPVLATGVNLFLTAQGRLQVAEGGNTLRFALVGLLCFVLAGLALAAVSTPEVAFYTQGTFVSPALKTLTCYGFFAMTMFAAIYQIVPRLTGTEWPKAKLGAVHFLATAVGVVMVVALLAIGGVEQAAAIRQVKSDAIPRFYEITDGSTLFLWGAALGNLLILAGSAAWTGHLFLVLARTCSKCCLGMKEAGVAK